MTGTDACDKNEHSDDGELRNCEELRRLADLTEDLFCVASFDGHFLGLNPSWERILGYTCSELTQRPFLEFVHPDDREATTETLGVLAHGESTRDFTNRYRAKDGRYRWLTWNGWSDLEAGVIYAIARDVTEQRHEEDARRRAREELARTNAVLESIRQIHGRAIDQKNPGEVFDFLLAEILIATKSEYGFIGEVLQGSGGEPYLKTQAITNIAWNDETRRFYEENAPTGLEFFNLETLFGSVLTSGTALIANDPKSHPRSAGLPEGHPPLNAFLGLPLTDGDGMVGMLGIANRPRGYDQALIEYLRPLTATTARLIRAYRDHRLRDEAGEELRRSEERWRRSVELAAYPVLVWDAERVITYANRATLDLLEIGRDELVGTSVDDLVVEREYTREETLRRYREDGWSHRITYLSTPSGDERPVELQAVDLGDGTFQAMAFDMREWVEIEARLKAATQLDNLTGLLNRRAIEEHAEVEIQRARRRATHLALLLIDIDHFKKVNDIWGHLAGDVALQRVSEILTNNIRPYDWLGRWGGEEFLVILPDTNEEQAHLVAERIRAAVAGGGLEATSSGAIPVTVSIGLAAVSTGATPSLRAFFERVDQALYAAKDQGRNRTVTWSEDADAA